MTPPTIRLLVLDDHPVLRDGLVAVLSTQSDFQIVGEAGGGTEGVQMAAELRPDVILLDLEMPDMDGVEALKQMKEADPDVRAIVFTAYDTDDRILAAVQGYILKGAPRDQVFDAIRVVHGGDSLLQPVVASKLLRRVSQMTERPGTSANITPRESEVLALLSQGLQNKEIGARLEVTDRTVKFHVGSILSKLQAGNRTEAVTIAVQRGLIQL